MAVTEAATDEQNHTIENSEIGRYGIPKKTLRRVIKAGHVSHNKVAEHDLTDSLDHWKVHHYLDQEQPVPDDATGLWKDVKTGRTIQIGKDGRMGWYVTRDYETHEMDIIEPGKVIPAIQNRRLIPVRSEDD